MKIWMCCGQINVKNWWNFPISNPKSISTISMHTLCLVKIHWYLLKLSSGNKIWCIVKNWQNLPIDNPKPNLHSINAHTEFGENPLTFTQVIVQEQKYGWMDWHTADRQRTDRHMDSQCDTIIPHHYHVVGYESTRFLITKMDKYLPQQKVWPKFGNFLSVFPDFLGI